jgi:excinuclease ABC subunit A
VVEHDMDLISHSDWIIDLGPGAGDEGGRVVASGTPHHVAAAGGKTARYLSRRLEQ